MVCRIGTHNGTFHCDEALAVFLLKTLDAFSGAEVIRTRDPAVLETCDIVVDVGGVYDEKKSRFDHHQRGFTNVFGHGFNTKLSSAGLVYKHFGRDIVSKRCKLPLEHPDVNTLWLKLYKEYIEAVDGIDNGVPQYNTEAPPNYRTRTDISARIGHLNPPWNVTYDAARQDSTFVKASELVGNEFFSILDYHNAAWLPARGFVVDALKQRTTVDPSGKIMLFEQYVPWKEHLFDLEEELGLTEADQTFYVIYPEDAGGSWRVQAVPKSSDSFESRKALPQQWRGLRDDVLCGLSGIEGCVFVHSSGFIGGNRSKEGALRMAHMALKD